jgi:hypothetical protein
MATVNIDYTMFKNQASEIIQMMASKEFSVRPIAVELVGILHKRIHTDGLAADGNPIGQYSENYLKIRIRRGLGEGTNIIAVLTRKLSNSWTAFATERGWAVGFVDDDADGVSSLQKLKFLEQNKKKKIIDLTPDERQYVTERVIEIAEDLFKKQKR